MNILTYNLYDSFVKNSPYNFKNIPRSAIKKIINRKKVQKKIAKGKMLGYLTHRHLFNGNSGFEPAFKVTELIANKNGDIKITWVFLDNDSGREAENNYKNNGWRFGCATMIRHINFVAESLERLVGFDLIEH